MCPVLLCLVVGAPPGAVPPAPPCRGTGSGYHSELASLCANHTTQALGKVLLCVHGAEILQDRRFSPVFLQLFVYCSKRGVHVCGEG